MIRTTVLAALVAFLIAGVVASATPSMASSPVIYGTNMGLYDGNEQLLNNSGTQQILAGWHTPVIRMPFRSSLSDSVELHAMQVIKSIGSTPLVIVHGAVDANVLADDQHLLSLTSQVFGATTVCVEYGNEEDLAGVNETAYTNSWNAVVPTLKAAYPTYRFMGPVNFQSDPTYVGYFVGHASPAPDVVSWHEYTCGPNDATSSCMSRIADWATHAASVDGAEVAAVGHAFPFMITEWNMDPFNDSRYLDPNVIGPWTSQALQELNSLVASGLIGAQQYVATSHGGGFELIDSSNNLTPQGQAFAGSLGGAPLPTPSPAPAQAPASSPTPTPSNSPIPSPTSGCGPSSISLSGSGTASILNNTYHLQSNEWSSSAAFGITSTGCAQFQIANSSINNSTSGAPGAYPSMYMGCHWGNCTSNSGLPLTVSAVAAGGAVTTSFDTTLIGSGAWDDAFDIWWNLNPTTSNNSSNSLEMMIWLDRLGPVQPAGSVVAGNASIGGQTYNVWHAGSSPGGIVSFVMTTPTSSVTNLDLGPLAAYAVGHGYMANSWYLIDVEAGFESWIGGQGLTANAFSVNTAPGPRPSPLPDPSPSPAPSPTPNPSPATVGVRYDFEDGTVEGWGPRWGSISVANSTAEAYSGTHSLAITSTGGYQAVGARTTGLTSGTWVTYQVWVPQAVAVIPFATDNAYHNNFAATAMLSPGWNTLTWQVPSMPVVTGIGLQVDLFSGTTYLDAVAW